MKEKLIRKISDGARRAGEPRVGAVIVAAGSSTRFGGDKLLAPLGGRPVLRRSLEVFAGAGCVISIVLVVRPDRREEFTALCEAWGLGGLVNVVPGGETRTASARAGVMAVPPGAEVIAIHDGARPLVTGGILSAAVRAAKKYGAAAPAVPVRDTIRLLGEGGASTTPDRSSLRAVQTPQCFQRDIIRGALTEAMRRGWELTDDCMAVEKIGGGIFLTEGSEDNIKITTPRDLELAELILREREEA